jgi:hypothetical protein
MNAASRAITRLAALASASIVAAVGGPPLASASVTIGGDIAATGTPIQCSIGGGAICEIAQLSLAGAQTQAPFNGVVVRWRVNGASGPLALRAYCGPPSASTTPSCPPALSRRRRAPEWRLPHTTADPSRQRGDREAEAETGASRSDR